MIEKLLLQRCCDHIVVGRLQSEDREMSGGESSFQEGQTVSADGRGIDQHFRQHHEGNGQKQQPCRETAEQGRKSKSGSRHELGIALNFLT